MLKLGQLRIKFIWGASKVIQARWRFGLWGFYDHAKGYRDSGLVLSVRGLLILAGFLAVAAYVAAGTALYLWLDRRPHNYVTYTDALLFPVRVDEIKAKRGQGYLDEGIDDLKSQHWSDAEMKLRLGLSRYPQAIRARLALAEFYFLTQRRAQALNLLEEGVRVAASYPGRRYLITYFTQASQGDDYPRIIAGADHFLGGAVELEPRERAWLLQQKIGAMLALKQTEPALALLQAQPEDPVLNEMQVLALLQLHRVDEAEKFLAGWRARAGAIAPILRLQVRTFRETGKKAEMEAALEAMRQQNPTDPSVYAYRVVQRSMLGDQAGAKEALADYFLRFGAHARSMLALAQPLAEIDAVELMEQYIAKLGEQGHDRRPALLELTQSYLKKGRWAEAVATMNRIKMLEAGGAGKKLAGQEFTELLLTVASNPAEGPQVQLLDMLNRQAMPLRTFLTVVAVLQKAERLETALGVLGIAERFYPGNAALHEARDGVQGAIDAQQAAVVATAGTPATGNILREKEFFPRVDEAMKTQQWAEAAAALRDVQLAKPAWLQARLADVWERQMMVAQRQHEPLEMILAAKLLAGGTRAQAQRVIDFAVALHAEKETKDAVLLLREVLAKIPEHGIARKLIEEWTQRQEIVLKSPPATETPLRELPAKPDQAPADGKIAPAK